MGDGEQRTGSSIGRVLAVQAVAYVVLFGVTGVLEFTFGNQGGVAQGVAIALAVVLLVLFQVGWPFRAGIADRLIGAVAGVLSILCARTSLASQLFYPAYEGGRLADDGRLVMYQLVRWAACFAILLIAATIIAFGRQMVRAERSHLIRALSHCMTGAVVSVSAAGWCFVPDLIDMGSASPDNGLLTRFIIVAAAFVVVAVLFAVCSVSWSREADPDPAAPAPWLGIGLLPVSSAGNIGLRQYAMRGVGIRHRCRGFPACGYEEGVRLLGFVFVKNQAGQ